MIQIRRVPEALQRNLKARAPLDGLSFSDYLLREIRRVAEAPTSDEIKRRLARHGAVAVLGLSSQDHAIRARAVMLVVDPSMGPGRKGRPVRALAVVLLKPLHPGRSPALSGIGKKVSHASL